MRARLLTTAAVLIALAPAGLARADEEGQPTATTVRELTITATRAPTPVADAPATVSVITDDEIAAILATDIKDLIRYEPGVSVPRGPARFGAALGATGRDGASGFNIRGLEGNRVLIQTDGVRLPDAYAYGPSAFGRGDLADLDLLKAVEILRGPASALYGSDGVAGAVSFLTRDPADLIRPGGSFGARARAAWASADRSWSESLVLAGRQGRWSGLVAYTRRDGHAHDTQGEVGGEGETRTRPNPQDVTANGLLAKLVLDATDAHRLRLTWDHHDREVITDVLSGRSATVVGLVGEDESRRDRVSLEHLYEGSGDRLRRARLTLYWQDSHVRQFTFEDRTPAVDRTRDNTFDNRVLGVSFEGRSALALAGLAHDVVWGVEASRTRQEGLRDGTVPPVGETFPTRGFPNTDYTLVGVFVQDEIRLADGRLSLFPALRWDRYELSPEADALYPHPAEGSADSHVSPKLGLIWRASETLSLFANAAAGFRAPSPSQVNNGFSNPAFGYVSAPNPDLRPETSRAFEAGVRLQDWADGTGGLWSGSLTAYAADYNDFIVQDAVAGSFTPADPAVYQYVNADRARVSGVEGRLEGRWDSGARLNLAAAWQRGRQTRAGVEHRLSTIEPFRLTVGAGWHEPGGRWGADLVATHARAADTRDMGLACGADCFGGQTFTVLDAMGFWNLTGRVALRAAVFNITDETYWWWSDIRGLSATSPALDAWSQPGRTVSVSLTWRY